MAQSKAVSPSPTFVELGVAAEISDALAAKGITHTFAIQELTLPLARRHRHYWPLSRHRNGQNPGIRGATAVTEFSTTPVLQNPTAPREH